MAIARHLYVSRFSSLLYSTPSISTDMKYVEKNSIFDDEIKARAKKIKITISNNLQFGEITTSLMCIVGRENSLN